MAESDVQRAEARHATPDVYLYLFALSFLVLSPGSIVYTPLQFIYKDQLHLTVDQTTVFKSIINAPGYLAFLFGVCRDRYNPLRIGDRGFLLIFGVLSCLVLLAISQVPLTIYTLGVGLILWGLATGMIGAAFQATMRNIAEARMMSGRMSAIYNGMSLTIGAGAVLFGAWLSDHMSWRIQLASCSAAYLLIAVVALWRPKTALQGMQAAGQRSFAQLWSELKLLRRHRAFWVAVLMNGIWACTPPGATPMQYYLSDVLKVSRTQYGSYQAFLSVAFVPTAVLFGLLAKRYRLWTLLLAAAAIGIPQWMPVIFVRNMEQVYWGAAFIGLSGGLANAAYYGLLLRACPASLAGTGMLVSGGFSLFLVELGNVAGGYIYKLWGFSACAIVTTVLYATLLPLCFAIPRALVEPRDDERVPTERELVAS